MKISEYVSSKAYLKHRSIKLFSNRAEEQQNIVAQEVTKR